MKTDDDHGRHPRASTATGFVGVAQDAAGTWWLQRKRKPATPLVPHDNITDAQGATRLVPNMLDEPLFLTIGTSHVGNTQPRDVSQTFDRHLNFSAYHFSMNVHGG